MLLPIGARPPERKAPVDPDTGHGLTAWQQHPGFTASAIAAMDPRPVIGACINTGPSGLDVLDIDGPAAVAWLEARGLNPRDPALFRITRTTDTDRFKIPFRLTPEQRSRLPQTKVLLRVGEKDSEGKRQALELYAKAGAQVIVLGFHTNSGGWYDWAGDPADIGAPSEAWLEAMLALCAEVEALRGKGDTSRPPRASRSGRGDRWQGSSPAAPCPVCGRAHSAACTRTTAANGRQFVSCFHGGKCSAPEGLSKGEIITGRDGQQWAFLEEYEADCIGPKSLFIDHRPAPPLPPDRIDISKATKASSNSTGTRPDAETTQPTDDPRGRWLQLLDKCQADRVLYPEAADQIASMARGIADASSSRPDRQILRDRLAKATGARKRWIDELIQERADMLDRERQAQAAEEAANQPPPTPAELEAQQEAAEADRLAREAAAPYRVLGWDRARRRIWFQHRETAQISDINPGPSFDRLLPLAPLSYWETEYSSGSRNGGADWQRAASALAAAADQAGVFDPQRLRGRGVWRDAGRTVWHLGDRLEVDGIDTPLAELASANHYPRLPALDINTAAAPLSDEQGCRILNVIQRMGWCGPSDHLLVLGWTVLSNVGAALPKRPGLQISSGFGSGKTDTGDEVISPLQGGLGISLSGSTEAGIRQSIRQDVLPVLVDESEQGDGNRREQQLRLVRLAYDGKPMVKGTPGGEALEFTLRVSIALLGINAPISNPADLSRIAVIGRRQLPESEWQQVAAERAQLITIETGQALIRRTIDHLPTLLANIATMGRVLAGMVAGRGGGRVGDTYGALLAGCHLLTSTALLDDSSALCWLDEVGWDPAAPAADEVDRSPTAEAKQCLDHLLAHEVPWLERDASDPTTGRITVAELLIDALAHQQSEAPNALGRCGMKADPELGLLVANSGAAIERVFRGSKWSQGGHRARLLELEGVEPAGAPLRLPVAGTRRCVAVPWGLLEVDEALVQAAVRMAQQRGHSAAAA